MYIINTYACFSLSSDAYEFEWVKIYKGKTNFFHFQSSMQAVVGECRWLDKHMLQIQLLPSFASLLYIWKQILFMMQMSPMTLLMQVCLKNSTACEVVSSSRTSGLIEPRTLPLTSELVYPCLKPCKINQKLLDRSFCTWVLLLCHTLLVVVSHGSYSFAYNWKWLWHMYTICQQFLVSC